MDLSGPPYMAQDYNDVADLKVSAESILSSWEPVRRVGPLDIDTGLSGISEGCVWLAISYAPQPHRLWHNYFGPRIEEIESQRGWSSGWPSSTVEIQFEVPVSDIEDLVEKVDSAIDYANEQFEANELREAERLVVEKGAPAPIDDEESAGVGPIDLEQLDELAARLARPDYDPPSHR